MEPIRDALLRIDPEKLSNAYLASLALPGTSVTLSPDGALQPASQPQDDAAKFPATSEAGPNGSKEDAPTAASVADISKSHMSVQDVGAPAPLEQLNPALTSPRVLLANAIAGGVAGTLAAVATTPLDVVKTQAQVGGRTEPVAQAVMRIARSSGVRGLFAGVGPRTARVAAAYAILVSLCLDVCLCEIEQNWNTP